MVSRSLYDGSLFNHIREGREGVQCERSLRFLLFLLDGWHRYSSARKDLYQKEDDGILSAIYFDKFAMLAFRLWDTMFRNQGDDVLSSPEMTEGITFPSPFQPIPGKHGPGPGRFEGPKGGNPAYLIDMLYDLQNEDLLHYFEVTPPSDDPNNHKNYRTTVIPAMPVNSTEDFLKGFTASERESLDDLHRVLKRLSPSEIRALGTHSSRQRMIEDVEREFRYLQPHKQAVISSLESNSPFLKSSRELMEYGDEAWRKSKLNKEDYLAGYRILAAEISNARLRAAFDVSQGAPDVIWDTSSTVADLTNKSALAFCFTRYLHAVAYYKEHKAERESRASREAKRYGHLWEESLTGMKGCGLSGFPKEVQGIFVDQSSEIRPEIRNRLVGVLETF
jgi:hypothetical protein